ncbi:hypothetical protein EDC39_10444 [Geothermobacter ehrlichii]|uniref:Uncharacterized protein n=1 Tax=Geothermobacter ehrlichii TaxID=213224 RepID=A0A5D3WMV7_9BACT|nr:hypothetical protein [Geothermobacter ehrlichii]TYO98920.1 hypothetical protein EDC39_10444 [Geothermobacter ehrlichii]
MFRVIWYGLVCDDRPVMTLGLREGPETVRRLRPGEPLIFRLSGTGGEPCPVVELVGEMSEMRDWFGRTLLRMRLMHALVGGRRLNDGQLHEFCCLGGWRRWLEAGSG